MAASLNKRINVYINTKLANKSIASLTAESRKLKRQINSLTPGTEAYRRKVIQLKATNSVLQKHRKEINNVQSGWGKLKKTLGPVAKGMIGIFAIRRVLSFGKELDEINNKAKGIQFAFDRLGERGELAFQRIKTSTRGLLSNLEIKESLVDFDNFNISLEETDTLFEFLAVRAHQTGKSVEYLKSSLVEGLSKESKLRIDNLGISAMELNKELEKTPDFVQAVANIAKREIAEAGNILDEAGNSTSKLNAKWENAKLKMSGYSVVVTGFFKSMAVGALDFLLELGKVNKNFTEYSAQIFDVKTKTDDLTKAISTETSELNSLFGVLTDTTSSTETRKIAIQELNTKYKDYLPNLITEKTSLNDIATYQEIANKALIKNIVLKQKQTAITSAIKTKIENEQKALALFNADVLKNGGNIATSDQKLRELIETSKDFYKTSQIDGKVIDNYGRYNQTIAETGNIFKEQAKLADDLGVSVETYDKVMGILTGNNIDHTNVMADIKTTYDSFVKTFVDVNEITKELNKNTSNLNSTNEKGEENYKKLTAQLEQLKKSTKALTDEEKIRNSESPEIKKIRSSYAEKIKLAEDLEKEKGTIGEEAYAQKLILIDLRDAEISAKEEENRVENEDKKKDAQALVNEELLSAREIEKLDLEGHFKELIALAEQYEIDTTGIKKKWDDEKLRIKKEYDQKEIDSEKEKNLKIEKAKIKRLKSQAQLFTGLGNITSAFYELIKKEGEENQEIQRLFTLAKIAFDTASAISSVIAAAASTSLTPIDLAVKVTAGIATVITNIAKAKSLMTLEQKAEGGYHNVIGADDGKVYNAKYKGTHPGGMLNSASLVLAAEAGPEYYVPNPLLSNQIVANHVRSIEAIRTGKQMEHGGYDKNQEVAVDNSESSTQEITIPGQQELTNVVRELSAILSGGISARIGEGTVDDIFDKKTEIDIIRGN